MATYNPAGGQTYTLGSSISSTQTTILLSSFTEPVTGTPYTMVLLNTDIAYGTIAPKTSSSEFISFTGITQNANGTATLTGVTRGLAKKSPFTTDAAYKLPHGGQSVFILSDAPQVFVKYVSIENDQTVAGIKTFSSSPIVPTPTTDFQAATKKYVDDVVVAGAPDASTTVKGISKLSTAPVSPTDPIAAGTNDTRIPTQAENNALVGNNTDIAVGTGNKFVTQTGLQKNVETYAATATGNDTYVVTLSPVPTSLVNGMQIRVKFDVANTGASTLNVNGLGAVAIVTGLSTPTVTGDIVANMIGNFIYNSTGPVWQLTNPASTVTTPVTSILANTVNADETIVDYFTLPLELYYDVGATAYPNGWTKVNNMDGADHNALGVTYGTFNTGGISTPAGFGSSGTASLLFDSTKIYKIKFVAKIESQGASDETGFGLCLSGAVTNLPDQTAVNEAIKIVWAGATNSIYFASGTGAANQNQNTTAYTFTDFHTYEIIWNPVAGNAKLYIDGTLVFTNTSIPTSNNAVLLAFYHNAASLNFTLSRPVVSIEM